MHGVAIGFEIGVGMGTFSLEESGWELGGIGFTSKLAITNSKYLICNRNHKSQWEHLSHCMHRHQLAQPLTRIRKKWAGTRATTGPCGWSSLKVALHFDSMKSIQRSNEFQSRLSMATLVLLHVPKPANAPFSPCLTQISFVPLLMGVVAQRQSSCGMVGSSMVRRDRFPTMNFESKFWSRKNTSPSHFFGKP